MANDLTAMIQPLLAQGMKSLRRRLHLLRYINRGFDAIPGAKFSTINIPIPSAITAIDVVPAHVAPDTDNIIPTSVALTMDQWKEAPFTLTDADLMKVTMGVIPMQADEAIKALANAVEAHVWGKTKRLYGMSGTPGTTPFAADLVAYTNARKILNKRDVDKDPRVAIIDADAEANAINLRAFQDASWRSDNAGIVEGEIGRKLGATWVTSNNVPTHVKGAATATNVTVTGANAVGSKTIAMGGFSAKAVEGDHFTIAGDLQDYVVVSATNLAAGASNVTFEPGLQVATAGTEVVTFKATYVRNILMHRDAITFGTRPLMESVPAAGSTLAAFDTIIDEETGLVLRLELTREHKQWRWSYDIMWGAALTRPDHGTVIAG